jgi:hypothetical protein
MSDWQLFGAGFLCGMVITAIIILLAAAIYGRSYDLYDTSKKEVGGEL